MSIIFLFKKRKKKKNKLKIVLEWTINYTKKLKNILSKKELNHFNKHRKINQIKVKVLEKIKNVT